jgi:hypothetical protein
MELSVALEDLRRPCLQAHYTRHAVGDGGTGHPS